MMPVAVPGRIPTGLLVSVRDVAEAIEAVEGGAAIVDVKDPGRGPLGRADADVAVAIGAVAGPRAAWTLACGELSDGVPAIAAHFERIVRLAGDVGPPLAIKAGPAGLDALHWRRAYHQLAAALPEVVTAVAVGYADWRAASCPEPVRLIEAAIEAGARTVLIDTYDKAGPSLLETVGPAEIDGWVSALDAAGVAMVLAGRLTAADVARLGAVASATLGVRSAACDGGRLGRVERGKVAALVGTLNAARHVPERPLEAERP